MSAIDLSPARAPRENHRGGTGETGSSAPSALRRADCGVVSRPLGLDAEGAFALIGEALYAGLDATVRAYLAILRHARAP